MHYQETFLFAQNTATLKEYVFAYFGKKTIADVSRFVVSKITISKSLQES